MLSKSKLKRAIHGYCTAYVNERIANIQEAIDASQASANEETKSSSGDKYETGRAMAQLEIERNNVQLDQAQQLLAVLNRIDVDANHDRVAVGSLVETSVGTYYVAISIGHVAIDAQQVVVLSQESPIGKLFLGKRKGDEIEWNKKQITITAVY